MEAGLHRPALCEQRQPDEIWHFRVDCSFRVWLLDSCQPDGPDRSTQVEPHAFVSWRHLYGAPSDDEVQERTKPIDWKGCKGTLEDNYMFLQGI